MTLSVRKGWQIRTSCVRPPIPVRTKDWSAVLDDYYDGAPDSCGLAALIGFGETEEAAIEDLIDQVECATSVAEL